MSTGTYSSWEQLSGYFDGDGSVGAEIAKHILRLRIRFVDTWKDQAVAIHNFLLRNGIETASITIDLRGKKASAHRVEVRVASDALKVARAMLPFCVKKAEDLQITIDYLEDRITADEAVRRFNAEIRVGRRKGHIRRSDLPLTRSGGIRRSKLMNAKKARAAYEVNVDDGTQENIREDHTRLGMGYIRLGRKYGYSQSVIRRILGRP